MVPHQNVAASFQGGVKLKNIELLRFLFAWAVVGFHIVFLDHFEEYGLGILKPYLNAGPCSSVPMFFVVAFFFLAIKPGEEQSLWRLCVSKWVRLAPLLIVITMLFYVRDMVLSHSFVPRNVSGNIENILLIQDWASVTRYHAYIGHAWWCAVYMLLAVFYVMAVRAFPVRLITLIVAICAYFGWRIYILRMQLPEYHSIVGHYQIGLALFCLGIGYAISRAPCIPRVLLQNKGVVWFCTFVESVLLMITLVYLFVNKYMMLSYILVILSFGGVFWLFINRAGYISRLLDNKVSAYLGRYAYSIFIVHQFILSGSKIVLSRYSGWAAEHPWIVMGSMALGIMIMAVLGHHYVEKPAIQMWKRIQSRLAE